MRKHLSTIVLTLVLLIGLSLLLYPTVSDYWNSFHQSRAVASYADSAALLDNESYDRLWTEAVQYNQTLLQNASRFLPSEEEVARYNALLDVTGTGIMGYVEIPEIDCTLPVYHGSDEAVLQIAVGHIVGTSLPVGGAGTHCVLSGHRGLPSAKLFTNLDQLVEGDLFMLHVLDETLTYEVDQIRIVLPSQVGDLEIDPDRDYCTLVTCTPYGVNSHRLLVRGHRVENLQAGSAVRVTADAAQVEPMLVASVLAVPLLLLWLLAVLLRARRAA